MLISNNSVENCGSFCHFQPSLGSLLRIDTYHFFTSAVQGHSWIQSGDVSYTKC